MLELICEHVQGVATVGSRVRVRGQRSRWHQEACQAKSGALCSRYTVLRLRDLQTCPQAGFDTEKCVMMRQGEDLVIKCFEVIRQSRFNFTEAEIQCQAWGGNLASILSEEEQAIAENVAYSVKLSHGEKLVFVETFKEIFMATESCGNIYSRRILRVLRLSTHVPAFVCVRCGNDVGVQKQAYMMFGLDTEPFKARESPLIPPPNLPNGFG